VSTNPPILEEQLLNLSARGRLIAGGLMVPFGLIAGVAFWDAGLIWFGAVFCVLFGAGLVVSAARDQARQRRVDAEVARARREWSALQHEIARCQQERGNVARLLQQRGYREFAVRRWIARELAP
jgi:hypothetical protein